MQIIGYRTCGFLVYGWTLLVALAVATGVAGCGDNTLGPGAPIMESGACVDYEALMHPGDGDGVEIPSITVAPKGVRVIVGDPDFVSFGGASYPVPGGRLAWAAWVYHYAGGERLGTIGHIGGDACRWYDAE